MAQHSNLQAILNLFRLTHRSVADAINVHYSLVSKWLSGDRLLNAKSPYIKQLVDLFIALDQEYDCAVLRSLLSKEYPDADFSQMKNLRLYLSRFLATDTQVQKNMVAQQHVFSGHIVAHAAIDVYEKAAGRRDACRRLLESALQLEHPPTLILQSDESLNWLLDDSDFINRFWYDSYRKILKRDGRVIILHSLTRKPEKLIANLFMWMPLHLIGQTEAHYLPRYSEMVFRHSVSLVRNHAVFFALAVGEEKSVLAETYFSYDPHIVERAERILRGYISTGKPLFTRHDQAALSQKVLQNESGNDAEYTYGSFPLEAMFSEEGFVELLGENGLQAEDPRYERALSFFQSRRHISLSRPKRCILRLNAVAGGLQSGVFIENYNFLLGKRLFLSPDRFRAALTMLCYHLRTNPLLSLALVGDDFLPIQHHISFRTKENTHVVFNASAEDTLSPILIEEPTVVHTFFQYIEGSWNLMPPVLRDTEKNIVRIRRLMET